MGQVKPVSFPKFPVKRCVTYKKFFVCYFCSYCRYLDSDMGQFAYFSFTAPLINTWQRIFVFIRVIRGRDQTVPMSLQSVFTLKWPKDKALQAATSSSTSVLSCEHIFYFLFLIKICQKMHCEELEQLLLNTMLEKRKPHLRISGFISCSYS